MRAPSRTIGLALCLAVVLGACAKSPTTTGTVTGAIQADGSSTVFPIAEAIGEEFSRENPDVNVAVGESGTGGGFKKFCAGETDISNASRPVKAEEKAACEAKDIEFIELIVANDGLSIVVNEQNDWVTCLTIAELKKIWEPKSSVKNWNQVRSDFPDQPMKLYGPGTDSGTFDYFTDVINGEEGASRTDYTRSEDDNTLVQGVAGDKGALGYFGFAYYTNNADKLNLVSVDGGAGCVAASDETVKSGTYKPLARPLYMYVKKSSLSRPEVTAFVEFFLDTVNSILPDVGYTPLSDEVLAEQKATFDAAV